MQVNVDRVGIDAKDDPRDAPEQHRIAKVEAARGGIERRDPGNLQPTNYG